MPSFFHSKEPVRFILTYRGGSVIFTGVKFSTIWWERNQYTHVDRHLDSSMFGLLQMELPGTLFWSASFWLAVVFTIFREELGVELPGPTVAELSVADTAASQTDSSKLHIIHIVLITLWRPTPNSPAGYTLPGSCQGQSLTYIFRAI